MARMKVTKKKLKEPDEFITLTQRTFLFVSGHLRHFAIGGGIALAIAIALFLFQMWKSKQQDEADRRLALAMGAYQKIASSFREVAPEEYKEALEKFEEVATRFPGTSSGRFALLCAGNIHLRSGDFEKAIKTYETFLEKGEKERTYRFLALEGLGYAYEGKKDFGKALTAYQKMTEMGESSQGGSGYFNVGRCYEKLGKNKEASENYRAFLKLSPKSQMANTALKKISVLEK